MPDCNENYESEIENGRNLRSVKCKYCGSTVLSPFSAVFDTFEFKLPFVEQKKRSVDNPETELVSLFWKVNDMFTFQNIGFSNTVGDNKYLTCADCDAGPIGYYDIPTKTSFVALSRVAHA